MNIRTFNLEDYDEVYALWLKTPGMGLNNVDDSREGIERFLKRNPNTCFVAESDSKNEIVGVILCGHDGRRGFIYHTSVATKYQRCGIGEMLVKAALTALHAEGISKVALVVYAKNEDGNAFWEHLGFTTRPDLTYRNKALIKMERIDT